MTTPAALAALNLVQAMLTPNLSGGLPLVIMMYLMIQGTHPEIIFELIQCVTMTRRQYGAIIMARTQLSLFASLLPAVKGVMPQTFQRQMKRFKIFPEHVVSRFFKNFQNSVLLKMLVRSSFTRTLLSLDFLQNFASNLVLVRTSPLPILSITRLFSCSDKNLMLVCTALKIQGMIEHLRVSYPEIVSFFSQNKNARINLIIVWMNQVIVNQTMYGTLFDIREPPKIHIMFVICILAVIDKKFIDKRLVQFIQSCGDRNEQNPFSSKHLDFLKQNFEKIGFMILQVDNIERVIELFSSMCTSTTHFNVSYAIKQWNMAFGPIICSDQKEFEEKTFELKSSMPIFEVFSTLWEVFFQNFSRTFAVSFLPFGNIPWSEGYTRLCTTNFNRIIRNALVNFAFRIGAKDNHAYIQERFSLDAYTPITTTTYSTLIFPDYIRICRMSLMRLSCFLKDFWRAHRKPDPTMSDIDYIRLLLSIPEYALFGDSWIKMMDALQNGTELPEVHDGLSGNFRYLSCPTDPTDPEVQYIYDRKFGDKLGKVPEIGDYARKESDHTP